jgi:hypothetical protein
MMVRLQEPVASALPPLCGLPLWGAGRAAALISFQFGDRCIASSGPAREVGTYALHLTCPWRLSGTTGVITGSTDIFVPGDEEMPDSDVAESARERMLVDLEMRRWLAGHADAPIRVEKVCVDRCGGLTLKLGQDFALEIFPDASWPPYAIIEQWRLLQPSTDAAHFVMLNSGVE